MKKILGEYVIDVLPYRYQPCVILIVTDGILDEEGYGKYYTRSGSEILPLSILQAEKVYPGINRGKYILK